MLTCVGRVCRNDQVTMTSPGWQKCKVEGHQQATQYEANWHVITVSTCEEFSSGYWVAPKRP